MGLFHFTPVSMATVFEPGLISRALLVGISSIPSSFEDWSLYGRVYALLCGCFACVVPFLNTTLLSFLPGVVSRLSCTDDPSGLFCVFVVYFYSLLLESLPPRTLFPS